VVNFFRKSQGRSAGLAPIRPSGHVLLWIIRGIFGLVAIGLAMLAFRQFNDIPEQTSYGWIAFCTILGVALFVVVFDLLLPNKQITTISAVYFGLLLGLLLGNIFSTALEPFLFDLPTQASEASEQPRVHIDKGRDGSLDVTFAGPAGSDPALTSRARARNQKRALLTLGITIFCCYVCISTLVQTKDEFRFIIPYVEFSKQVKGNRPLVLDTSVIIDGRIADICDTRFIDTRLIVPRFVLQELQSVADSSDKLKRNRGRRGLDMLKRMQNNAKVELHIHEGNLPEVQEASKVDERLVLLAKALNARVVTNDFNLNKMAQLQGVEVINLNELANALKSVALPGEGMVVRLVKPGDQLGQGVGYLEDGTMVVVEQGRPLIGHEVAIVVTSVLQTPAGRMIFGRVEGKAPGADGGPAASVGRGAGGG
jgi:uncharacterized protein YacL